MNRTVYFNGKVHTMDSDSTIIESFAVENGKFVWVGSNADGIALSKQGWELHDLLNAPVYPSFIDAHLHMRVASDTLIGVDLSACETRESYKAVIEDYVKKNPNIPCVNGFGWRDRNFDKNGPPKDDLDEISREIPIVLKADSGHGIWVNSKALEIAGINKDTKDDGTGVIMRNADGEPSGAIFEDSMYLVTSVFPDYSTEQYKNAFVEMLENARELGITGCFDAWLDPGSNSVAALRDLAQDENFIGYIRGAYALYPYKPLEEQLAAFCNDREINHIGDKFQMRSIKLFLDGVIESRTGYLLAPYSDNDASNPDFVGVPNWEQDALNEAMVGIFKNGFQVQIHCIGDAAVRQAVLAFEYAKQKGFFGERKVIIHIELIHNDDLNKFKELDITPVLNPHWAQIDDFYFIKQGFIGQERVDSSWPINSLIKRGLLCGAGSDYPVTTIPNCFVGIEHGVTRTASKYFHPWVSDFESGKYSFSLGSEDEKALVGEMLRMFTYGAAYSMFLEEFTGSIEVGKNADFIITNQDIFTVAQDEISGTKVNATYFNGKCVYQRK